MLPCHAHGLVFFKCRNIQETQMKYLSEWDQWKRYSSKSWKRFLEKAREMTTHLELWRKDIRSIEGRAHRLPASGCAHLLAVFHIGSGGGGWHGQFCCRGGGFPSRINIIFVTVLVAVVGHLTEATREERFILPHGFGGPVAGQGIVLGA